MDWLEEELGSYDDDYLIIDCPGIILLCGMKSDTVFLMSAFLFFSFFFFFFLDRTDRAVYASSISSNFGEKSPAVRYQNICGVSVGCSVYGR